MVEVRGISSLAVLAEVRVMLSASGQHFQQGQVRTLASLERDLLRDFP